MTTIEDDLLTALKELLEASQAMTGGMLPSADDMDRYNRAVLWSNGLVRTEGNNGRAFLLNGDDIEQKLNLTPSV